MEKFYKKIMGANFIGSEELLKINAGFGFFLPKKVIPAIPISLEKAKSLKKDCILILGVPGVTINKMRKVFGFDPKRSEPCFYNQDWYSNEKFAKETTLDFRWYLIKKTIDDKTRGRNPKSFEKNTAKQKKFPSAVLVVFTFFAYYFLNKKEILWKNDFIWCDDKDFSGDQVYVGRYKDPKGINKNGFNIHRHLSIKKNYGFLWQIKI